MAVIQLTGDMLPAFSDFLTKYEYKSVSLINRIYRKNKIVIPTTSAGRIYCEVSSSNPDKILNLIMVTSGGIILPVFSKYPPASVTLEIMIKKALIFKRSIFCILGIKRDTLLIKEHLRFKQTMTIEYLLMTKAMDKAYQLDKALFKIYRADKNDADLLFNLEKDYLREEVLIGRSELNLKAALSNLRLTCTNQIVYFAFAGSEAIAKVNTNGKSPGYNQIGGVFTKKEFRGRGISTYLMKALLNDIHKSGKNSVLYVKKDNIPAIALYKKLGFIEIDNYQAIYNQP